MAVRFKAAILSIAVMIAPRRNGFKPVGVAGLES
jgi:hypothetical protein